MIALLANPEQIGHRSEGHPERPERVTAILDAIEASALGLKPEVAPPAPESMIDRVHDSSYVAMLDRAASSGGGFLDPDTYITPLSMLAARTAAGAVGDGVDRGAHGTVKHASAVERPRGHHTEPAQATGLGLPHTACVGVVARRAQRMRRSVA